MRTTVSRGQGTKRAERRGTIVGRARCSLVFVAALMFTCMSGTSVSQASQQPSGGAPSARLAQAQSIRAGLQARIDVFPRMRLSITEAAATGVIESYALLTQDLFERRRLSAEHGISYAICATGGVCPYLAPRLARPAADYLPRRLALELAARTFLETDATLVVVTLPTPHLVAFVAAREDLSHAVDMPKLVRALSSRPLLAPSASLRRAVDELTRPRTYVFLGFEPTPTGGVSWAGMPRWPIVR